MKKLILSILMVSFFMTACDKDDDTPCEVTDVAAEIVGSWTETPIAGVGDEVTFNSDFSGSCTAESLFSTEVNGNVSNTFTWELNSDNSAIDLDYPNGLGVEYQVLSVDCDEITLELFGFDVKLNRK